MIDHLLHFQDEAAAKAALPQHQRNGNWLDECVIANPIVKVQGVRLSGFLLWVSLPVASPALLSTSALLLAIDRSLACNGAPGTIIKTPLAAVDAQSITIDPMFAGSNFAALAKPQIGQFSRLTFIDDFESQSSIDVAASGAVGFKWYPQHWFGSEVTPPSKIGVANSVLELAGVLQTAIISRTDPSHYIGSVFGGGAYFEARIAFDPARGALASQAFPAFWSMAIEHIYDSASFSDVQWTGQAPGYAHFIELDFMEAFHLPNESYVGKKGYYGTIHDWSGTYGQNGWTNNIQNNGNKFSNVGAVDWSAFHTYGCLWVPATATAPGYVQWFFDNKPGSIVYWKGPIGDPPLPTQSLNVYTPSTPALAAATYAKLDEQRLALSLMTDPNWPMLVDWVKVWQAP